MQNLAQPTTVPHHTEDRQWDCRFNVQLDSDLESLLSAIRREYESGKLKYVLVGGLEVGTRAYQDDYKVRHVHVAAMFANRVSKRALLKNWNIKEGNGYYLVPRNRDLPYSGWRNHHVKEFSKINPSECVLLEMGTLPEDTKRRKVEATEEEKKKSTNDILIEMREMLENGKKEDAFRKYPRTFLQYGERLQAMLVQKKDFFKQNGNPNIWLYGYPGTGKTAVLNYVYPNAYKKNLYNKFFDLYDPEIHTHVLLEDLDHEAVERLSINFLKTICDEAGFAIDQKYKSPQLTATNVLVTSNFTINQLLADTKGVETNQAAIHRRFWHVQIYELLRVLGIKLLGKYERNQLKKSGNTEPGKLFIGWDYLTDLPTCTPIQSPEAMQKLIKDHYYK